MPDELPEIDLNIEKSDFGHLRVLAPFDVLELDPAHAHLGDPAQIKFKIAVNGQLSAGSRADSRRDIVFQFALIQSQNENDQPSGDHHENAKNSAQPNQDSTFLLSHKAPDFLLLNRAKGIPAQCRDLRKILPDILNGR